MKFNVPLIIAGLLILSSSVFAFEPIFDARIYYPLGHSPESVFNADLDGDGDIDLAVANSGLWHDNPGSVSILFNGGDGIFSETVNYLAGEGPVSVFGSDLDSDGDVDLAVANLYTDDVSILKNNGDGTFAGAVNYAAGQWPTSIYCFDLDGDGDIDLAVTNRDSDNVSILLNAGNGTFAEPVNYGVGDAPWSVFSIDLDNDGDGDLAVANSQSDNLSVLINNGDGAFHTAVHYDVGEDPFSVFAADLDNDGDPDLAVTNGRTETVSILSNTGDGTFADAVNYDVGDYPRTIYCTDLDGDSYIDLTVGDLNSGSISILFNEGDGTFAEEVIFPAGNTNSICGSDLDDDGDVDLAVVNSWLNSVTIMFNDGNGSFEKPFQIIGSEFNSVSGSDLDSDGDIDLVANKGSLNKLSILFNMGDGNYAEPVNYDVPGYSSSVVCNDLDGDNDIDLAVAQVGSYPDLYGSVYVLLNNGDGTYAAGINYEMDSWPSSIYSIDLDNDGDADLVGTSFWSGDIYTMQNEGNGTFTEPVNYNVEGWPESIFGSDLDGDSDIDLTIACSLPPFASEDAPRGCHVMFNFGDGTFSEAVKIASGTSVFGSDFDGDNDIDLAVTTQGTASNPGFVSILMNIGDGTFAEAVNYWAVNYPGHVYSSDFDGDGDSDLAVASLYYIFLLINNGDGSFAETVGYETGWIPFSIYGSDLDGDNDIDLAMSYFSGGGISILFNLTNKPVIEEEQVAVDIKPGSCPNPLNLQGNYDQGKSVLPVAVLGTEFFDVRDIDVETITLNGVSPVRWSYEDVSTPVDKEWDSCACSEDDPDGFEDLTLKFDKKEIIESLNFTNNEHHAAGFVSSTAAGNRNRETVKHGRGEPIQIDQTLIIAGNLTDETSFEGYDCVRLMVKEGNDETGQYELSLNQNYPNPFNPITGISFSLPKASHVRLDIFNILGQKVTTLIDGRLDAGEHKVIWDGSDAASGVYFYRLSVDDFTDIKKMLLLK